MAGAAATSSAATGYTVNVTACVVNLSTNPAGTNLACMNLNASTAGINVVNLSTVSMADINTAARR
jgi:hypothetical protein